MPKTTVVEKVVEELCGHINRHSYGVDGKPDNLACVLPKGHEGDHSAPHKQAIHVHKREDKNHPKRITEEYLEEYEAVSFWGDMAGIPPEQIPVPQEIKPPSLLEQDFGADIAKQLTV